MKLFSISTLDDLALHLEAQPLEIRQAVAQKGKCYRSFRQPKPNGTFRTLYVIDNPLKLLQQKIKSRILDSVRLPDCVHGGVIGRSVTTNALPHVGKEIVFSTDLRDFFPSVRPGAVRAIFSALGIDAGPADILTEITTWDGQLPQGCSTSTSLANLAMLKVDMRIMGLARQHGFAYTRWIDDLTVSGGERLLGFRQLISRIISEEGFAVNPKKPLTMHSGMRQTVTGVVVNRKLNVPREDRAAIRQRVLEIRLSGRANSANLGRVRGKLSWLSQINPRLGARLASRLPS